MVLYQIKREHSDGSVTYDSRLYRTRAAAEARIRQVEGYRQRDGRPCPTQTIEVAPAHVHPAASQDPAVLSAIDDDAEALGLGRPHGTEA